MKIEPIPINSEQREMTKVGNFPELEVQIMLADKINEIINWINRKDDQLI